ncbi:uncharacterized protein MELLADRAFT_104359 [Melampsora larici-populina 98AG31]|uniref:Uncharacterized protein n=1 Tax=Melampsora larici-populina (strain 98AG31 / pathotype 3-4-7) TaxID=747676 RepID=F4REF6_MELLP|nr:uncharacterized protein MELLADRAFT_104359 [Melampsora larici-populina 98AG31]EGG09081.1 hypothetical protein MELLADRAFT_104359 [Melampsora larici-populina 98AG31]
MSEASPDEFTNPFNLLGASPDSDAISSFLAHLVSAVNTDSTRLDASKCLPITKSYPDKTVYHTYPTLGIALEFRPSTKPQSDNVLRLVGIEIENHTTNDDEVVAVNTDTHKPIQNNRGQRFKTIFAPYRGYPILVCFTPNSSDSASSETTSDGAQLKLYPQTTGKEFLENLGEPSRKGGQDVLKMGSGIWLEWTWDTTEGKKLGLFVQWRGAASIGPGKWEKGRDRKWGTLKIFLDN